MADNWEIFDARMNELTGQIKSVNFRITDSVTGGVTKTSIELDPLDPDAPSFVDAPTRQDLIDFVTTNAKATETSKVDGEGNPITLWDYWADQRANYSEPDAAELADSNPVVYANVEYDRPQSEIDAAE